MNDLRIPFPELTQHLMSALVAHGFDESKARDCAMLFAKADLDGVRSHGVNRFFKFLDYVKSGIVMPQASPKLLNSFQFFERWDGQRGPGNLNASQAMKRAIELSEKFGIGTVALGNTNHWMRAGNYGWQAVEANCIGVCFSNTKANMPAWGGSEPKLGNNPLVIAIPRSEGHVVLDMAMSQFAYGKMTLAVEKGEDMPYDAGFDEEGRMTRDPLLILKNEMALPAGLWKGSGLSLMIDLLAAILSGGDAVHEIQQRKAEAGLSQVFIAMDPVRLGLGLWMNTKADAIIEQLKSSATFSGQPLRYPGEQILQLRKENMEKGVPVSKDFWNQLKNEI